MTQENNDKWVSLVQRAVKDDQAIKEVFSEVEGTLYTIAKSIASQLVDDAVQAAKIKIWKSIKSVDVSRPDTIKSVIIHIAVLGMRDEVRKYLRRTDKDTVKTINDEYEGPTVSYDIVGKWPYGEFLEHYLCYIRMKGTMKGSHQFIATKFKMPVKHIKVWFKGEVEKIFPIKVNCNDGSERDKIMFRKIVNSLKG